MAQLIPLPHGLRRRLRKKRPIPLPAGAMIDAETGLIDSPTGPGAWEGVQLPRGFIARAKALHQVANR
jgi:hypothetical protein